MSVNCLIGNNLASQVVLGELNSEQANILVTERARQLVKQLIEHRGQDRPPFLPREFECLKGIKRITKENLGDTSAILLRFSDGYEIKVNRNHSQNRQNFSCAHEIGHILFDELELVDYVRKIEYRTFNPQAQVITRATAKERLCDAAATELLMPEDIFKKYLLGFGLSVSSLGLLSNIFQVSIPAVAIRIAEVSQEPCVALKWNLWQRRGSKALRLYRQRGRIRPIHTLARLGSSLFKAYQSDNTVKCYKLFKFNTVVKRCYMESKGFGYGKTRYVISLAFPER